MVNISRIRIAYVVTSEGVQTLVMTRESSTAAAIVKVTHVLHLCPRALAVLGLPLGSSF